MKSETIIFPSELNDELTIEIYEISTNDLNLAERNKNSRKMIRH